MQNVDAIKSTQYSEQLFERYAVITPSFSAEGVSPPAEIEAVFGSSFRAPPAPIFGANETGLDKILTGLRSGNCLGPNNAGPDFIVSATPKPAPKPVKPQPKPEPKPVVSAMPRRYRGQAHASIQKR